MTINVIKLNKDVETLTADKAALVTKVTELETMVENLQNMSKDMTEAQATHNTVIETMKTEHEKQLSDIKAEYEAKIQNLEKSKNEEALTTANKAADIVASLGVEPEAIKVTPKEVATQTKPQTYKVVSYINNK